ncbi:MAG: hypothetical protein ACK4K9_11560 [Bacteroidia bacterium]
MVVELDKTVKDLTHLATISSIPFPTPDRISISNTRVLENDAESELCHQAGTFLDSLTKLIEDRQFFSRKIINVPTGWDPDLAQNFILRNVIDFTEGSLSLMKNIHEAQYMSLTGRIGDFTREKIAQGVDAVVPETVQQTFVEGVNLAKSVAKGTFNTFQYVKDFGMQRFIITTMGTVAGGSFLISASIIFGVQVPQLLGSVVNTGVSSLKSGPMPMQTSVLPQFTSALSVIDPKSPFAGPNGIPLLFTIQKLIVHIWSIMKE